MIAYLEGTILAKQPTHLVVANRGVGYKVFAAGPALNKAKIGQALQLYIHTHIREDQFSLYGFLSADELDLFELLLSVSGVGPKVALAVMSGAAAENIRSAIASGDPGVFTKVSGVGKKTAERIVMELKEKIGESGPAGSLKGSQNFGESLDALLALGYNQQEARQALRRVPTELTDSGSIVKAALKILGGKT